MIMQQYYSVMGTDDTGKNVFYAEDENSGGYPYASGFNGKQTPDLITAVGWLQECGKNKFAKMDSPTVVRIVYEPVDTEDVQLAETSVDNIIKHLSRDELAIIKRKLK